MNQCILTTLLVEMYVAKPNPKKKISITHVRKQFWHSGSFYQHSLVDNGASLCILNLVVWLC